MDHFILWAKASIDKLEPMMIAEENERKKIQDSYFQTAMGSMANQANSQQAAIQEAAKYGAVYGNLSGSVKPGSS